MTSTEERRLDRLSTSREYEAEAEQTRRRLADNLDALSDRLTPGQMFDEMLAYSRAGGGALAQALTNAMRENPLPSFLIGAGCLMVLSERMGLRAGSLGGVFRGSSSRTGYDPYADARMRGSDAIAGATARMTRPAAAAAREAAGAASDAMRRTAGAAGDTLHGATDAVSGSLRQTAAAVNDTLSGAANAMRSTTHDLRDQASDALHQVGRSAAEAAGTARETSSAVGARMMDTAGRSRRAAFDAVRSGRETAASFVAEQPLLSAAIAVAIGAVIASLIPSTETEKAAMGDMSDRVKGAAGKAASDALDSAKTVAAKTAERVKSAAREEGFSPSAVGEAAKSFGEGVHQGLSPESAQREPDFDSSAVADAAVDLGEAVRQGRRVEPATGGEPQEPAEVRGAGP